MSTRSSLPLIAYVMWLLPVVQAFQTLPEQAPPPTALDLTLQGFSDRGTFVQILSDLAVQIRPTAVIGFEKGASSGSTIDIEIKGPTSVREVLSQLCAADRRYRFTVAADGKVINLLSTEVTDVTRLMDLRLERFDLNLDDWPANWYAQVAHQSPEVKRVLEQYYRKNRRLATYPSGAGANMETDVRPPHLEMHLTNVTVVEILNELAKKELDWASKENASAAKTGTVWYPVFPFGWKVEFSPIDDLPLNAWLNLVFGQFPPSRR